MFSRLGQVLYWAGSAVATLGLASCVSVSDFSPALRQHAECAVETLRSMPGVSGVDLSGSDSTGNPVGLVSYYLNYAPWHHRRIRYNLFSAPIGAGFDPGPDTNEIATTLAMKCGISFLRV
jgi:hypothetical protein